MAIREEFKAAIQAGKLQEAFAMAMTHAAKLEITTWVSSQKDPKASGQPGKRLRSRLNLLENKLEHEIGEAVLDSQSSSEIQQFHSQQVADSHSIIEDNLQSLQNIFEAMITVQQSYSFHSRPLDTVSSSPLLSPKTPETELPDLADEIDEDDPVASILEAFAMESPAEDFSNPVTPASETSSTETTAIEDDDEDWDEILDLTTEEDEESETVAPSPEEDSFSNSSESWDDAETSSTETTAIEDDDEDWDEILDLTTEEDEEFETVTPSSEEDSFHSSSETWDDSEISSTEDWEDWTDESDSSTETPSSPPQTPVIVNEIEEQTQQEEAEEWDNWDVEDQTPPIDVSPLTNVELKEEANGNNIQTSPNPFSIGQPLSVKSEEAEWNELNVEELENNSNSLNVGETPNEIRETPVFETEIVVDDESLDWDEYDIFDVQPNSAFSEEDLPDNNENKRG